jgi:hypothetical protein
MLNIAVPAPALDMIGIEPSTTFGITMYHPSQKYRIILIRASYLFRIITVCLLVLASCIMIPPFFL